MKTYQEFLKQISNYYSKIGFTEWPSAPIVHNGFPGNFNLSLTEYEFLRDNKNFFDLQKNMRYSKTQPCIRHNDFCHIKKLTKDSYRYLLRFSMAAVGGITWSKNVFERDECVSKTLKNLLDFLVAECGLKKEKIYVQYLKSDKISVLTDGKYDFPCNLPDDPNVELYEKYGILKKNFLPVRNRDGLLALNIYGRSTPWGYRNEIFYEHKGELLDIATLESLVFKPVHKNETIVGLSAYPYTLVIGAIGVERVLMIMNNFTDINEIELIAKPSEVFLTYSDQTTAKQLIQILRAVQLILAEAGDYQKLSKSRKEKLREYFKMLNEILEENNIPNEILEKAMIKISECESNLPQLKRAIDKVVYEYKFFVLRNKHKWKDHSE